MKGSVHMRSSSMSSIPPLVGRKVLPDRLVRLLLLRSGDVETNPGPVERASTMVLMPMSTSTPTLEPLDSAIYAAIIVPLITVLCVCLLCTLCCCVCCCWRRRHRYYSTALRADSLQPLASKISRRHHFEEFTQLIPSTEDSDESDELGMRAGFEWASCYIDPAIGSAFESSLRRLCLIPFDIKQLTISPTGGNFTLGCGDAVLIVEVDSVAELTDARYAIILHGPFVHLAGYKPASVVVYLNLEGATLLKPVKLKVRHWCKDTDVESSLRLMRAPHTVSEMQDCYIFDDIGGTSSSRESVFSISEPQCLYCVEMKAESQARYNAFAFIKNLPDTTKFRIQLMCDSLEWNVYLTKNLEEKGWENSSKEDVIASFSFTANQITATPHELSGPGWKAAIHGHQAVREADFLRIRGKSKDAVAAEVHHGRYPPGIHYQVLFTRVVEQRPVPTFWRAELLGADVNLFFICNIKQEEAPNNELSVRDVGQNAATAAVIKSPLLSSGLPPNEVQLKDLVKWVVPRVAPKWDEVGLQLNIQQYVLRSVEADGADVVTRCKNMFAKWLDGQNGTGDLPRTWESVLEAVREAVGGEVCRTIEQSVNNEDTNELGLSDPPAKKAKQ